MPKGGRGLPADIGLRGAASVHLTAGEPESGPGKRKEVTLKAATIIGILLIVLGIVGFAVGGVSFTREKKDIDMGPIQVQHKQTRTVPISPVLSTIALVGGITLVVVGARK